MVVQLIEQKIAALHKFVLALSGQSSRARVCPLIGQERTTGDLGIGTVCPLMTKRTFVVSIDTTG